MFNDHFSQVQASVSMKVKESTLLFTVKMISTDQCFFNQTWEALKLQIKFITASTLQFCFIASSILYFSSLTLPHSYFLSQIRSISHYKKQ